MSAIPTRIREGVRRREFERCLRCSSGNAHDIHHRQRRRDGGHTLENCILLCRTCHEWVHKHPLEAKYTGFIVSFAGDAAGPSIKSWRGWMALNEDGTVAFVTAPQTD